VVTQLVDCVDEGAEHELQAPSADSGFGPHQVGSERARHRQDLVVEVDPEAVDLVDQHARGPHGQASPARGQRPGGQDIGVAVTHASHDGDPLREAELGRPSRRSVPTGVPGASRGGSRVESTPDSSSSWSW
jgi:hypothetical protein